MADLSVNLGGLRLDNPIIAGSATPTWDGAHSSKCGENGAGGVVLKTIAPGEDPFHHPQNGRFIVLKKNNIPYGMINVEIFSTMPESSWLKKELKAAKANGATIIASTLACADPKDSAELMERVESTGYIDAFELNNSCPMHVSMNDFNIVPITVEQTAAARKATKLPLFVKFPSTVTSLANALKAAEACGADGIVVSNSMSGFAGVDIDKAAPYLGTLGGYSGCAIKPLIEAKIIEAAGAVKIPIIAVGGINSWKDVIEYIMLGASAVETVSEIMWNGYGVIKEMTDKIASFMDEHHYASIEEMRGIVLPEIGTYDSILTGEHLTAHVKEDTCRNCAKCIKTCFYDAISKTDKIAVDSAKCDGCGLCVQLCPFGGMELR